MGEGLFASTSAESGEAVRRWRVSSRPFSLVPKELEFFRGLGTHILAFTKAVNILYFDSVKGNRPRWIADYLDQGKPENVVEFGRMNRFKQSLPGILRPDIIPVENGMVVTELDSVPGGIGLTGLLEELYAKSGFAVAGPPFGMVEGFARLMRSISGKPAPVVAIAVSEESKEYRPEMAWLAKVLPQFGVDAQVVDPGEMIFREDGLWLPETPGARHQDRQRIDVIYRFFELFDLKNIRKSELIFYAARKGLVAMTPPPKAHLEEKMAFALFHHPALQDFWEKHLSIGAMDQLGELIPKTWILDPAMVPPHAVIPGLSVLGRSIQNWSELAHLGQKERAFVVKPSGFSELAWGSRGVSVGHDLSEKDWGEALAHALGQFERTPYVLQEFRKGKRFTMDYYDPKDRVLRNMDGRVRLSPYYYVIDGEAVLSGILASFVPADKKLIHGMSDAVMAPCAVLDTSSR